MRQEFETYWRPLPWKRMIQLPVDFPENRAKDTRGAAQHVIATLSQEETTVLFTQVVGVDTTILDVLLTALMRAFVPWIGSHPLYLDIVEMGREPLFDEIDLSHTIGQMTLGRWLLLHLDEEGSLEEALQSIKTQIRAAPNRGIGPNLYTFLSKDPQIQEVVEAIRLPEVLFNYMGQMDSGSAETADPDALFSHEIQADLGAPWDPRELRDRSLHFALGIVNGEFGVFCEYGQELYRQATIGALVDRYMETLRALLLAK
jgi:non-ribosomal peptide synthase protein (TIGR01720 family)